MKNFLIIFLCIICLLAQAQLKNELSKQEAVDMIALCTSYTFLQLYGDDADILPKGYKKVYTSEEIGMDNRFQIYKKGNVAVINFRGSTGKKISWLENLTSSMISAKGTIRINNESFKYCFAQDPQAAVHSGFALAVAYLHDDVIKQIKILNEQGINNFLITGHSQGGALTNMFRAYLENLPETTFKTKNFYKNYAFAAPKIGNKAFIAEFSNRFCATNTSFGYINPKDPVAALPISYNDTNYLESNIKSLLFAPEEFSLKKVAFDGAVRMLEDQLQKGVSNFSHSTMGQVEKNLGNVVMPPFKNEFNYGKYCNLTKIKPFEHPKALRDSSVLENDSLLATLNRDEDGHFLHPTMYKLESPIFQHKPYNYYVTILEMYFPHEYKRLKVKVLPENI